MSEVVKQGDTDPIVWELADAVGLLDLSDATVTMLAYGPEPATTLKFSVVCPTAGKGRVTQTPLPAHFNTPGHYDVVFFADWGGGRQRRFPTEGFLPLRVDPSAPG